MRRLSESGDVHVYVSGDAIYRRYIENRNEAGKVNLQLVCFAPLYQRSTIVSKNYVQQSSNTRFINSIIYHVRVCSWLWTTRAFLISSLPVVSQANALYEQQHSHFKHIYVT